MLVDKGLATCALQGGAKEGCKASHTRCGSLAIMVETNPVAPLRHPAIVVTLGNA